MICLSRSHLFLALTLLSSTVLATRRPRGRVAATTSDPNMDQAFPDSDTDVSSNRRTSSDFGSASTGDAMPDFVRIEIEIQRLENPSGILLNGKKCDMFKSCDPRVSASIDSDQPESPWPGPVPVKKWPVIFEASNTNSPTIGKSITKDICGGSISKVNLRVHVVDVDTFTRNDELMNFDCIFDVDPHNIAVSAGSANWGPSTTCTAAGQAAKIRLFTRMRVYQIPASDCSASGNGQSTQPVQKLGQGRFRESSGTSQDSSSNDVDIRVPGQHDFVRVEVELVRLLNPQGVADNGKSCDTSSACDPMIFADLDTDRPLASWPGSRIVPEYQRIFKVSNNNSPVINKNISTNICGGAIKKMNLRVHVVDSDSLSHNDLIGDFQCVFTTPYRIVAPDISSSDWSSTQDCEPLNSKNDIRLQYRYRLYDIPMSECGIRTKPSSTRN